MIYVRVVGGIGNQLLRYAAARALATRNNTELVIDLSWFRDKQTPTRRYALEKLNISGRRTTLLEHFGLYQIRQPGRKAALVRTFIPPLLRRIRHVVETDMPFKQWIHDLRGDVYLDADCYSEKYFEDIEPQLRKELTLRSPTSFFLGMRKKMAGCNSIALHIRRGDFVWNPKVNNGTLSQEYYQDAVSYIAQQHPNPIIFVFSDDLPWVKEHLKLPYSTEFVEHPTEARDWEEIFLIASCKHQITANSSFSWWGAWLNTNPDKIVCAPKQWFLDPTKNTIDVVPSNWHRI